MNSLKDFEIQGQIGSGSFSKVYKVKRKSDNLLYAMKKVQMNQLSYKEQQNALNEVRILASIENKPNVISYKECFFDDVQEQLFIIMEFADGGDLKDLKAANVFLTLKQTIKIGDLNVSKVIEENNQMASTQTGTPYYASPEIWLNQPYNHKSDIWSLGVILYELATLKHPFRAQNMPELYKKIQRGNYDKIPSKYSPELNSLIQQCLCVNPKQRPNCEQILNNCMYAKKIYEAQTQLDDLNLQNQMINNVLNHISLLEKANSKQDFEQIKYRASVQENAPSPNLINQKQKMFSTIKLPRNLKLLNDKLPKPRYDCKSLERVRSLQQLNSNNISNNDISNQNNNFYNYQVQQNQQQPATRYQVNHSKDRSSLSQERPVQNYKISRKRYISNNLINQNANNESQDKELTVIKQQQINQLRQRNLTQNSPNLEQQKNLIRKISVKQLENINGNAYEDNLNNNSHNIKNNLGLKSRQQSPGIFRDNSQNMIRQSSRPKININHQNYVMNKENMLPQIQSKSPRNSAIPTRNQSRDNVAKGYYYLKRNENLSRPRSPYNPYSNNNGISENDIKPSILNNLYR